MKDKKQLLPKVLYLVLAAGMFYLMKFPDSGIKVGKITIMYCYLPGLAIIFLGGGQLFIPPSGRADASGGKVWSWTRLPLFFQRLYFHDRVGH